MNPPPGSPADRLHAAAAATRVAAAFSDAWNAPPPDPATGQLWRARWGRQHQLVVLLSVAGNMAAAAPVCFERNYADDTTELLSAQDTTLNVPLAVWTSLTRIVPMRVLDRMGGDVTTTGIAALDPASDPKTRHRGEPIVTPVDTRAEYRAVLEDTMTEFAAATWTPRGEGTLPAVLRKAGIGPADIANTLQLPPQQALQLLRGSLPLKEQQAELLTAQIGLSVEELLDANPALPDELIARLDRPACRARVTQLARRRKLSEPLAWQTAAYDVFALAARQTGPEQSIAWDERIDRYFTVVLDD